MLLPRNDFLFHWVSFFLLLFCSFALFEAERAPEGGALRRVCARQTLAQPFWWGGSVALPGQEASLAQQGGQGPAQPHGPAGSVAIGTRCAQTSTSQGPAELGWRQPRHRGGLEWLPVVRGGRAGGALWGPAPSWPCPALPCQPTLFYLFDQKVLNSLLTGDSWQGHPRLILKQQSFPQDRPPVNRWIISQDSGM